ncbi:hypothetical protein BLOT_007452 [Blomia tropicalis]|nr:hypothetical protein BLOT_007452 [Blomia tropicalis]
MVENSRDFFHLNSHLILDYQMNHSTTNPIKSIKSKLKMVYKIWNTDNALINFLIFEFGWFTMSLQPEVKAIQQLYQSDSLVFKLLQCFQSKHFIMEKIKLSNYYELLHTNNREYFTIGDLAKINQQTILQFYILYSSALMHVFKIFHKSID